ncbi:thiamine pyrophosphate-binding protein [Pigmentiphaga sp.]|uniref:thiamine pyrophosphate-binding protein n=1 Tax=Pigmentiphaga sp. TaxID=1977564 RepID=UPI0025DBA33B|nr:thiamine pyrophosphate-binding protein [Pigmentiphaga sp.]
MNVTPSSPSGSGPSTERTASAVLASQLAIHGVKHIFCVPGESYLAVLDALLDVPIEVTVCRQESGAAMMAEAQAKLTGTPGICFVTRGPGATNAAAGIHVASQDSTPMILFVGQVARDMRGRESFQELDYPAVFGSMAKWVVEIDDARRIPELLSRAFHVATSGRPGPVVVALPEDMLTDVVDVPDALAYQVTETYPAPEHIEQLQTLLANAQRPLAILGGSRWSAEDVERIQGFAQAFQLPVVCSFRRQMLFPQSHPCYAGELGFGANPRLLDRIRQSDLILLIGGRLSEAPSQGYSLLDVPNPRQKLVHVHTDPDELGRVYRAHLAINATPRGFCASVAALQATPGRATGEWVRDAAADAIRWRDLSPIQVPGELKMPDVMRALQKELPRDTIICNGAGNFCTWGQRFWPFEAFGTQLAPTSGSMGYGFPAGVGAKRLYPDKTVVVLAGDGDFLMTGQEFATAVQYELPLIVLLIDNGMYGTIRAHQERGYPGRVSATTLRNPDFVAYARAFGGYGERLTTADDCGPALRRALASGLPSLLHCVIDPEAITPSSTLTQLRTQALERLEQAARKNGPPR